MYELPEGFEFGVLCEMSDEFVAVRDVPWSHLLVQFVQDVVRLKQYRTHPCITSTYLCRKPVKSSGCAVVLEFWVRVFNTLIFDRGGGATWKCGKKNQKTKSFHHLNRKSKVPFQQRGTLPELQMGRLGNSESVEKKSSKSPKKTSDGEGTVTGKCSSPV